MDKCTKYINLFLFSLFQSCTQHFYHGRQYGNHNNGHNQQFEVLLYKRKVTEEITRITEMAIQQAPPIRLYSMK